MQSLHERERDIRDKPVIALIYTGNRTRNLAAINLLAISVIAPRSINQFANNIQTANVIRWKRILFTMEKYTRSDLFEIG